MLRRLTRGAENAWRYLRRNGPRKFAGRVLREIPYRLRRLRSWFRLQLVGRYVELRGNAWTLDGLRFSLDAPAIATSLKSRFVWGTYEDNERILVPRHVVRDLPVIEAGASIGVIACVTNRLLRDPTKHLVVEANPGLQTVLARNRDLNGCSFRIVHAALAHHGPAVTFHLHKKFVGGSVQRATGSEVTVPAVTLAGLLEETGWERISLICDIEGGEIDLIEHEGDVLRDHVAVFIVEMHPFIVGEPAVAAALQKLGELGFSLRDREEGVHVFYRNR